MGLKKTILLLTILSTILPFVSAAHYVVGVVNGDSDGKTVYLYNPSMGISKNISDIVGPTGNSGVSKTYMIDVEMLYSCSVGDEVRVTVDGSRYVPVIITGAGYDVAPNLTLGDTASFEINVTINETISINDTVTKPVNDTNTTIVKPKPTKHKRVTAVAIKPKITYSWVNQYLVLINPLSKGIAMSKYVIR